MILYLYFYFFLMKRICYVLSALGINLESLEGSRRSPLGLCLHLPLFSCLLTLPATPASFPFLKHSHAPPLSISCICCPQFVESFPYPEILRMLSLFTQMVRYFLATIYTISIMLASLTLLFLFELVWCSLSYISPSNTNDILLCIVLFMDYHCTKECAGTSDNFFFPTQHITCLQDYLLNEWMNRMKA